MSKELKPEDKAIVREMVALETREVPLWQIICQPEINAFRDEEEFSETSIKALAQDIAISGQLSPFLGQQYGNKVMGWNCHRRHKAMLLLVEDPTSGWTLNTLIKVEVMPEGTKRLEALARAISSNIFQKPFTAVGRAKATAALHREGMPTSQISAIVNSSVKTVERDLTVATAPKFLQLVEDHNIQFSTTASLLEKAKKANPSRVNDLYDAIIEFVVMTKAILRKKDAAQIARGAKPMAKEKMWPQKHLSKSQVANWDKALGKGEPLTLGGSLPFSALIEKENGVEKVKITPLNLTIATAPLGHVQQVFERVTMLAHDLERVLLNRVNQERLASPQADGAGDVLAEIEAKYQRLGLDDLLTVEQPPTEGEDASDMDEVEEREEIDALDGIDGNTDDVDDGANGEEEETE